MNQILDNHFNVNFENNSNLNYLVLGCNTENSIINYQIQMLLNNKLAGLLDFNINCIEGCVNCFYDITSKCTLDSFATRKQFNRNEFLITVLKVIRNIGSLKDFLLTDNNILLDERYIYVEPEKIEIYFVYIPFNECKNDIKAFFYKLIFELIRFRDEDSDNYLQKILEFIKSDLFNLVSFKLLIEELLGEFIRKEVGNNVQALAVNKSDKLPILKPENSILSQATEDKAVISKQATAKQNIKIPTKECSDNHKQQDFKRKQKKKVSILKGRSGFITIGILQPIIFISLILIMLTDFVKFSDNPKITMAALIIIFLAIDILLVKIIREEHQNDDINNKNKVIEYIKDKMIIRSNMKVWEASTNSDNEGQNDCTLDHNKNVSGETTILKRNNPVENPYIKDILSEEIFEIKKKNILVGRLGGFVDYVIVSSTIGKIHAEIIEEEGEYYIMDCNSRNGTYINNIRITPNSREKIINGDLLRFANMEYVFINMI